MKKHKLPAAILAAIAATAAPAASSLDGDSWFSMKASANNSLDLAIYDEIGGWGVTGSDFKRELDGYSNVAEINLSLHSPGGSVWDGLAIYNQLVNHPATVNVYIDGVAASIAAVIAMAGDVVTMPENAFLMIHKASMHGGGNEDELRKNADLLAKVDHTQIAVFRNKTGLSDADLSEMLAAETWLTGVEAVEIGFADTLAEPMAVAASFNSDIKLRPDTMPKKTTPTAAAETTRRAEINAVFKGHDDYSELHTACVDDMGVTAREAGDKLLTGNGAIIRDSIRNSVAARAGMEPAESGNRLSMAISFDPLSAINIDPPASKVLASRFLF